MCSMCVHYITCQNTVTYCYYTVHVQERFMVLHLFKNCMRSNMKYPEVTWGEAGGELHRPTGPFGVAMSPRSASHRPRHDWRALRDVSPTQG